MDTLFRLVSLQSSDQKQQHSNSSNSTTTSRSTSKHQLHHHHPHHPHHNYQQQQQYYYSSYHQQAVACYSQEEEEPEECNNHNINQQLYMDDDHFSSSSKHHQYHPSSSSNPNPADFSLPHNLDFPSSASAAAAGGPHWATDLLLECGRAVATRDTPRVQQLMWTLNELSSPYGDVDQKIASYFLQAIFARLTSSGPRTLRTLLSASDRTASFDSTRRIVLRFQELSPWSSFGHVASNGAILESFLADASQKLHILDLSNTFCTQWPTLLEALATRSADDTPHLTITTIVSSPPSASSSSSVHRVMKEIGARMEKFARLMGVPFKFNIVHHVGDLSNLDLDQLNLHDNNGGGNESVLAINCVNSLHSISPVGRRRDSFLSAMRRLQPRVITVVEEEADLDSSVADADEGEGFLNGFRESVRFFSAYFDSLEESFPKTSNERLALERAAGRAMVDLVACPAEESVERRERASGWSRRLRTAGLEPAGFSDDVADDVRALLRRYKEGWAMRPAAGDGDEPAVDPTAGIFLTWKEQPVVWASAWRVQ